MNNKPISNTELIALISAAVMLIAFVFLHWANLVIDGDLQRWETGIGILRAGQETKLAWTLNPANKEITVYVTPGDEDVTEIYLPQIIQPISPAGYFSLFLIPLAAIGGGALTVWGLTSPDKRKSAIWLRRVLALGSWFCYPNFIDFSYFGEFNMVGIGFWIAWASSIGLLFGAAQRRIRG